jgi:hypothetical protein
MNLRYVQIFKIALLAGFLFSQTLVQDIIQQLNKPNNYYGDVAPLIARMNAEAATPPPGTPAPPVDNPAGKAVK